MLFPSYLGKTLAAGVALLGVASAVEVFSPPEDCDGIDFASQYIYYGQSPGGSRFCATQILKSGALAKRIETWSEQRGKWHSVVGMRITYDNDDYTIIGSIDDHDEHGGWRTADRIDWNPSAGEFIEYALGQDWDDGDPWVNVIKIKTTSADPKKFLCGGFGENLVDCKDEKPKDNRQYSWGTLLSISGQMGIGGIERIEFKTLHEGDEVRDSDITDIEFSPSLDDINRGGNGDKNITARTLMTAHCINNLDTNVTYMVKNQYTYKKSQSVTKTTSDTFHVGSKFTWGHEWGVAGVAATKVEVSLEFFWERKIEKSNTDTKEEADTRDYGPGAITVKPNSAVRVTAYVMQGVLDLSWKAKRVINLHNGRTFALPVSGTLSAVRYSDSWHFIEEEEMSNINDILTGGHGVTLVDPKTDTLPPVDLDKDELPEVKFLKKERRFIA